MQTLHTVDAGQHTDPDEHETTEETTDRREQDRQHARCAHEASFEHTDRVTGERVRKRVHAERRLQEQIEAKARDETRARAGIGTEVITDRDCGDESEVGRDATDAQVREHRHLQHDEQREQENDADDAHDQPPGREVDVDENGAPGTVVVVVDVVDVVVVVGAGMVMHETPGLTTGLGPPATHNKTDR